MIIVKVLKRKDASSLIVAIVLATIVSQLLPTLTGELSGILSGLKDSDFFSYANPDAGWQVRYLQPVILALLELIALEILARIVVALRPMLVRKG